MSFYEKTTIHREQDLVSLIFKLTGGEGFIAGGFARYCVSRQDEPIIPGDIDIFCGDQETFERIAARFKAHPNMVHRSRSDIEVKWEYRNKSGYHRDAFCIQLIRPSHIMNMVSDGDYEKVLDNFDFTIAKCAILPDGTAMMHQDFHHHDRDKRLVIENIHCPISSCKRVIKYCLKGFTIESKELLKLFNDFEARPPEWKELVREGLANDGEFEFDDEGRREKFIQTMYLD